VCNKSVAKDLEQPSLALPAGAAEGVNRRADLDIYETTLFEHTPPTCARQATGSSIGPKVDIADRGFRYHLAVGNVGKSSASSSSGVSVSESATAFSFACSAEPDSGMAMTLPLRMVQASATAAAEQL
jgi:transcription elongation factor